MPGFSGRAAASRGCGVRCVVRLVRSTSPTLTVTTKGVRCNFGLFSSRAAVVPCTSTCSAGGHVRRSCRASKICQQQQRTNTVDPKSTDTNKKVRVVCGRRCWPQWHVLCEVFFFFFVGHGIGGRTVDSLNAFQINAFSEFAFVFGCTQGRKLWRDLLSRPLPLSVLCSALLCGVDFASIRESRFPRFFLPVRAGGCWCVFVCAFPRSRSPLCCFIGFPRRRPVRVRCLATPGGRT
ncbi:hypothetical protein ISCGN_007655, partial [Ixodes scapularis]